MAGTVKIKRVIDHRGVVYYKVLGPPNMILHPSALPNLFPTKAKAETFARRARKELKKVMTNPRSLPTRFIPAKFKTPTGTVSGEVRRNPKTGRVQIKVNPTAARKLKRYAHHSNPDFRLYEAAKRADDNFHAAVEKVFGKHRAGDMRYRSSQFTPEIKRLAKVKHAADKAWLEEMRKSG